jgi:RND family efflux transporter MFP subunit
VDDKKELLSALAIDDREREVSGGISRYLVTGFGALVLAAIAWFWLLPIDSPVPVDTAVAEKASAGVQTQSATVLNASGFVTARRKATVSSKITGKVLNIFIEEGLYVEQGYLLATLDDSVQRANLELSIAKSRAALARLDEVKVRIQEAELNLRRTRNLEQKKLASTADLDTARLALAALEARLVGLESEADVAKSSVKVLEQQLKDTEIRAPFAGVVILKAAQPGEMISPITAGGGFTATGICTLVDMDSLEIEVDVSESYINRVKSRQQVTATLNSYEDWAIPAEVIAIIPTADRNKATVKVRIAFLEKDDRILPEMGVKVSFLEQNKQPIDPVEEVSGVMVPSSAITIEQNESIVYVVDGGKVFVRKVRLGRRQGQSRNIVAGLNAGETIVMGLNDALIAQLSEGRSVTAIAVN